MRFISRMPSLPKIYRGDPLAAVEHWIQVGAPDESAPYALLGQVDAGAGR